jgi:Holliday junction DNA helicase RuvA
LKDKAGGLPTAPGAVALASAPVGSVTNDAVSALQNLGFKPQVAVDAVARAVDELGDGAGLNYLIRVGLKRAAG